VGSCLLDKVKTNLKGVDDIDDQFNLVQVFLRLVSLVPLVGVFHFDLIDILEHIDVRTNEKGIDGEYGDEEVPHLAEGTLSINEIPLQLWLGIDDLVLFISIFVNVIDHHFFQI